MNELVTVFGGGGFLGRYLVQELLRGGARVRVAERDPFDATHLKPLGGLGQAQAVVADITKPETVARAVHGTDVVINLVGIMKGRFQAVHVHGARTVAEAATRAGARRLIHLSAIGADPNAASAYARSKGEGEQAVHAAFLDAAIVRPSILFGPEDQFVNRFAGMMARAPIMPVIRPDVRFQPAWVVDVARAVCKLALSSETMPRMLELGGPQALSMMELHRWIGGAIGRTPRLFALPDGVASMLAGFGGLPGAPISRDQLRMLDQDNVVSPGAQGFAALGIEPAPLAAVAQTWLVRYRREGRFSLNAA
ncbi:complex I NDUFA9 subunit family protein [uncultured Sphingomonas sp.]|uniref:complex I NDUFA9 subunit family protein n=1 Tax=uncultured Sphingomonas sp. TaxID=158754 RepID=UPI0025D2D3D8|nr:complex I NDUFA9 subunit family protein [uncultured Sphingomonas sp.]